MDKETQEAYDYLKKLAIDGIKTFNCPDKKEKGEGKRPSNAYMKKIGERVLVEVLRMEMAEKKQDSRRAKIAETKKPKTTKFPRLPSKELR